MATSILNQPQFQDANTARQYLEAIRWPHGPVCPHCGSVSKEHYALNGGATRPGVYKCKDCRKQFTVTVGTVFERSKVPLHQWMQAVYLICSSKKGCSSHQLQRTLGVQYKTAWFMTHRLREAMKPGGGGILGGGGKIVEADADDIFSIAQEIYDANEKLYGYISKLRELIPTWHHIRK